MQRVLAQDSLVPWGQQSLMFPKIKPSLSSILQGLFQVRLSPALSPPAPGLEEVVAALAGCEGVGQGL